MEFWVGTFKFDNSFGKRQQLARKIKTTYPNHVPVIIEVASHDLGILTKSKYLVPAECAVSKLLLEVRKQFQGLDNRALFLMTDKKTLAPVSALVGQLYSEHADQDGFLYLIATSENPFG